MCTLFSVRFRLKYFKNLSNEHSPSLVSFRLLFACVTFNFLNTCDWFKERVYKLKEEDRDVTDKDKALQTDATALMEDLK